jgi:hypothetical protein
LAIGPPFCLLDKQCFDHSSKSFWSAQVGTCMSHNLNRLWARLLRRGGHYARIGPPNDRIVPVGGCHAQHPDHAHLARKIDRVSKQYRLGGVGTGTLTHDMNRAWAWLRGMHKSIFHPVRRPCP